MHRRTFIKKGALWMTGSAAFGIFVPRLVRPHGLRGIRLRHDGVAVPDSFDGVTYYVNTASESPGGDGTTNNTTGASRAFKSCNELLTSLSNLIDPTRAFLSGTTADTTACTQGVWDFETTSTNRLYLIGNNTTGKYNTSAWRLEVVDSDAFYNNLAGHVEMLKMQVQITSSTGSDHIGFRLATANNLNKPIDHRFIGCIAKLLMTGSTGVVGFSSSDPGAGGGTCRIINCIAHGTGRYGYNTDESAWAAANVYNYNSTNHGNHFGFLGDTKCLNCLSASSTQGGGSDFNATGSGGHSNNASSDGSALGTNSRTNQTFSFVNAAGGDFQLQAGDTGAKGFGLSDPASGLFSDDITGAARTNPWDIGAWRAAA